MGRQIYPTGYFKMIRPAVIKMMIDRVPVKQMSEMFNIKHMTLSNMINRDGLSAVRVRYLHSKGEEVL